MKTSTTSRPQSASGRPQSLGGVSSRWHRGWQFAGGGGGRRWNPPADPERAAAARARESDIAAAFRRADEAAALATRKQQKVLSASVRQVRSQSRHVALSQAKTFGGLMSMVARKSPAVLGPVAGIAVGALALAALGTGAMFGLESGSAAWATAVTCGAGTTAFISGRTRTRNRQRVGKLVMTDGAAKTTLDGNELARLLHSYREEISDTAGFTHQLPTGDMSWFNAQATSTGPRAAVLKIYNRPEWNAFQARDREPVITQAVTALVARSQRRTQVKVEILPAGQVSVGKAYDRRTQEAYDAKAEMLEVRVTLR